MKLSGVSLVTLTTTVFQFSRFALALNLNHHVNHKSYSNSIVHTNRRNAILTGIASAASSVTAVVVNSSAVQAVEDSSMYNPKFVQEYPDFVIDDAGWSFKDVKIGASSGEAPVKGDRVVYEWSGYTIGYFGRPFEAKVSNCRQRTLDIFTMKHL